MACKDKSCSCRTVGTFIRTTNVSSESVVIDLDVTIDNDLDKEAEVKAVARVYKLDEKGARTGSAVAVFDPELVKIGGNSSAVLHTSVTLENPRLWGLPPTQTPNLYLAETILQQDGKLIDTYTGTFGIRSLEFDGDKGVIVNGEPGGH